MRIHKPLWHDGILLLPQLFQQQETFHSAQMLQAVQLACPYPWGVSIADLDKAALQQGLVKLENLVGIWPDGTTLDSRHSGYLPPARHTADLPADLEATTLRLAVPLLNPLGNNLQESEPQPGDIPRRYLKSFARIADQMGELEDELAVEKMNFLFKFDGEPCDGMATLPIARLIRNTQGLFEVDAGFIPPLLHCSASPALLARLARLAELLEAKQAALLEQRRERNHLAADYLVSDIGLFWLMNTIGQCWPELRMLAQQTFSQPYSAYLCLARLAGMLCTFSLARQLADIPAYDPMALGTVFGQLDELIRDLMDTVIPSPVVRLALKNTAANLWVAHLADARLREGADFYLSVRSGLPLHVLQEQLPRVSKAGSPDEVALIMSSATNGIPLKAMQRVPSALPTRVENLYFALDSQHPAFASMLAAQSCAFYFPSSLPELQLEFYAVPRS